MTSIIKNQLVKHLSKFARNLKPEQISLDVLKGKSELRNIELNEEVLTEVLELPIWLKIKKANCNRVAVRVPWTNLKSKPVELFIDEITVSIVLSADRSPSTSRKPFSDAQDTGSYGFAEKIVEGMSIYVNTLEINFDSGAFGGSFMLSRLSVESRTPGWALTNDLRKTRLHCHTTHRVLCYKQVSWQLLRIEASARTEETQRRNINAPLRLITSGGKIRICLKKNSQNGNVIHARISMLLDDILWVATLPQIRSAIAFYSHMMKLVNAAEKAAPSIPVPVPSKTQLIPSPEPQQIHAAANSMFRRLDLDQTSYHLQVKKIDLHLCDDNLNAGNYPKDWNIEAGAMQVTLHVLLIDVYPKTLASSDRSHWVRYTSPNSATSWMGNNLKHHFAKICEELDETTRMRVQRSWPDLMSFNVVVRVYDMVIQCVSDMRTKKEELQNMFTSDRNSKKSLPSDQYILHAEFANFFHPMTDHLPVPPPATFAQLGPFSLLFDKRTLRWILFVVENLQSAMIEADAPSMEPMPHTDIRIDLLMPKVIIHLSDPKLDARLPHRLIVSLSTVTACNNPFDVIPTGFSRIDTRLIDYVTNTELPEGKTAFRGDLLQMNNKQTVFGIAEGMQWWLRTSPLWIDTDHGEFSRTVPLISDVCFHASITTRKDQINVYVEPQTEVTALVDHFQFLQLTRLGAELSDFADLIKADQGFFQKGAPVNAPIIVVLVAINEVRAKLLLTSGPLPSPYETNQAFPQNNFADDLSVSKKWNAEKIWRSETKSYQELGK
ncbi:unnamed protein product, partial [Mesorhabditis belari]|uniref:Chorein N-terminal domain-containing protein n=1 Tax=Mesorhabditis belari TaxID=2138241 RepID=A0AAF3ETL9_9BILA